MPELFRPPLNFEMTPIKTIAMNEMIKIGKPMIKIKTVEKDQALLGGF